MLAKNRIFIALVSFGYLLTITVSALFHTHGDGGNARACRGESCAASHSTDCGVPGEERPRPKSPGDCEHCPVCQFLAQQPAPPAELPPPEIEAAVDEIVESAPVAAFLGATTAWWSRGPPSRA
ncbi:MAG: hypothetical protein JW959_11145 [Pirellulales bacterium]|nr:hypothetical protein [Pirellulales bacterium]